MKSMSAIGASRHRLMHCTRPLLTQSGHLPGRSTSPFQYASLVLCDVMSWASGEAMRRREFVTLFGCTAVAWPFSVRSQQAARPVIGFMSARSPYDTGPVLQAFLKGLGEAGFFDGQNVTIEYRWARGEYDRLPALAAEFVQRRVNVLVATGGEASAVAAKQATSMIPIVFVAGDPVKDGLVASLNRPGGNATGSFISTSEPEMEQKRLSLLHELTPGVPLIGALVNPNSPDAARQLPALEEAARIIERRLAVANASKDE